MRKPSNHFIYRHQTELRIPFFDVDSMNIVWHGNYVEYLELARCDFLEKIDYNYIKMKEEGYIWPIAQLQVKYIAPVLFNQEIIIETRLIEYETCLKIDYLILDKLTQKRLSEASTMQICVSIENQETAYLTPETWRQKIKKAIGDVS